MSKTRRLSGFTLIEILVVVALIAILTAITFIAINPGKNFADARNTTRATHVSQILSAVSQYLTVPGNTLDNLSVASATSAAIPPCSAPLEIGSPATTTTIDLKTPLVTTGDFIVGIPVDPASTPASDEGNTGYTICRTGTRVTIASMHEENGATIEIRR